MARARRLAASGVSINAAMPAIYSKAESAVIFLQLCIPVRHVGEREEGQPLLVEGPASGRPAEERRPARADGKTQEMHPGLLRRAPALAQVAGHAGADHVLPTGHAPAAARDDVVQVQLGAGRPAAAVLAGVAVARVDVQPAEAHAGARQVVVGLQQDHPRHADALAGGADRLLVHGRGQLGPALEVERLVLLVDRLGGAAIEKDQRPAHGSDVHGLVEAVQDQDARRKHHTSLSSGSSSSGPAGNRAGSLPPPAAPSSLAPFGPAARMAAARTAPASPAASLTQRTSRTTRPSRSRPPPAGPPARSAASSGSGSPSTATPAPDSLRSGSEPPPTWPSVSTTVQLKPFCWRSSARRVARCRSSSGAAWMAASAGSSCARPSRQRRSLASSAARFTRSTRRARLRGWRRQASTSSRRPRRMPACGPPRSLSPEIKTRSAPSRRLWAAIVSASAGSSAPLPRSCTRCTPRTRASAASSATSGISVNPTSAKLERWTR